MKLLIATNNEHKINEITQILYLVLHNRIQVVTPKMLALKIDVEETEATLEGNAELKANKFFELTGLPSIADDTGLEISALDGRPGVHSARFAGEPANDANNRKLVLDLMIDIIPENRKAKFRTVICYCDEYGSHFIDGSCEGKITPSEAGSNGFGYDSIFMPDGFDTTFAQMSSEEKNQISHRSKAINNFVQWLKNYKELN